MTLDDPVFSEFRVSVIPAWEEVFELFDDANEKAEIVEFAKWLITKKSSAYETLKGMQYAREEKDLSDVTLSLVEDFKADHKKMDFYQKVFRQYVIAGKELNLWTFDIPKAVILAPREKNPINPERFNLLPKARLWQEAFHAAVRDVNVEDEDLIWGQLLLSAVFYGGLINSQLLIALIKSILGTERFHLGKRYLDLRPTWQGHEEVEYRRWFFDPLTELISVKYQKKLLVADTSEISSKWIIKRVNKTLARHLSKQELPSGITDFLDAVSVRYSLRLPPFLVSYAERKSLSHSLKVSAWDRLSKTITTTNTQEQESVNLSQWQKTIKIDDSDETLNFFYDKKLAEIRDCLKTERADLARKNLSELMSDKESKYLDYYYLLADWLRTLSSKTGKSRSEEHTSELQSRPHL